MKLWTRTTIALFALALVFNLSAGTANAAAKKKKKEAPKQAEVKKEEAKKEVKKEHHAKAKAKKEYISGTNIYARSGLFYGDTSEVAAVGQMEGSAHAVFQSFTGGSNFLIPFGGHVGVADNLEVSANGTLSINTIDSYTIFGYTFAGGSTSNFSLDLGGKYRIAAENRQTPDFSLGADVQIPTSGGSAVFTPKGTATYVLDSGLLLNGEVGVGISTVTYIVMDAGAALPITPGLTGIAEIGANQMGYSGSVLAGGIRAGTSDLKFNALLGIPLNGGGGIVLGGGIILASK